MSNRSTEKSKWQKIRKLFNDIHLWLGLTSGLVVIAVCFSGTVYVFNTELTEKRHHIYIKYSLYREKNGFPLIR